MIVPRAASDLGLTIVKTCIESCGGTVVVRNRPEGGLEVQITPSGGVAEWRGKSEKNPLRFIKMPLFLRRRLDH